MGSAPTPSPNRPGDGAGQPSGPADIIKKIDKGFKPIDEVSKWTGRYTLIHGVLAKIILVVAPLVGAAFVWLGNETASYLHILGVTAPLTVAVMVLVPIYRKCDMSAIGNLVTTILVLAAAAFLSKLLGIGAPVPPLGESNAALRGSFPAGILLAILSAYFHVYHAGPFCVSVITGAIAGIWLSTRS